jgi:putative ABC transport system permease protein
VSGTLPGRGFRRLFRWPASPDRIAHDVDAELRFHLDSRVADLIATGMLADDARRVAEAEYGDLRASREELAALDRRMLQRQQRTGFLEATQQDLQYAMRTLRRAPGFTLVVVTTLAVGIGAATAVFSLTNAILVRRLPFAHASHLALAFEVNKDGSYRAPSYPTYRDWEAAGSTWRGAIRDIAWVRGDIGTMATPDGPVRALVGYVTPNFFDVLGARPLLGRTFTLAEAVSSPRRSVVLSYDTWRSQYGGDSAVIGRTMDLDGATVTIIGVMPPDGYPTFAQLWQPIGAIEATDSSLQQRGALADSRTVVRIADGADSLRAAIALQPTEQHLAEEYPSVSRGWTGTALYPIRDEILGDVAPTLYLMTGAVGLVLLLACANVAGLFGVRGAGRVRELAVRSALGAGRGRMARQLLIESLVLGLAGGAGGILLAYGLVDGVRRMASTELPRPDQIALHPAALAFAFGASLFASLLVGVGPALGAARTDLLSRLRGSGTAAAGRQEGRVRYLLAVAQLALAVILLAGAGLLLQSFRRALTVPLGFDPTNLVTITVATPADTSFDPARARARYERLAAAVRAVPGVTEVALVNHAPLTGAGVPTEVEAGGSVGEARQRLAAVDRSASANYLRTMRMHLRRGRWLNADDMRARAASFVVNETLARQLWPGRDAVGQPLVVFHGAQYSPAFGKPMAGRVVGVVADVRQVAQDVPVDPEVYAPYTLEVWTGITVVARARDPARIIPALRNAVHTVVPRAPLRGLGGASSIRRMSAMLSDSLERRRLAVMVVTAFAGIAVLLAALGLYGVISYGVALRTRELGLRTALGATRGRILRLVLGQSARIVVAGLVVGVAGAAGLSRLIASMLFHTPAVDPVVYAATSVVLALIAAAATIPPARRAARVDPTIAMRAE